MAEYHAQLVKYKVGDVDTEVSKEATNYVHRLVLCAQDEMTSQTNDGQPESWVLEGEHALKKKGVGRGMHQSEFICSTFGWLSEASQSLEYGKNYEGYWTGELFVKQVCCLWHQIILFLTQFMISLSKSSFLLSREHMAKDTELWLWLTILRDTQHMPQMPSSHQE